MIKFRVAKISLFIASGMIWAALSGLTPAQAQAVAIAENARVGQSNGLTRLVVDFDNDVDFIVFAIDNPYRVIIDLPEINFQLPPGTGQTGKGVITAFRYGLFAPSRSRIVIDIDQPVLIDNAFMLKRLDGKPPRLVLDLKPTDQMTFAKISSSLIEPRPAVLPTQPGRTIEDIAGLIQSWLVPEPPARPRNLIDAAPVTPLKRVVILDPGHGGVDPGTTSPSHVREKDVVLNYARMLRDKLIATGHYEVYMTRDKDTFIRLRDRVKFARTKSADLFISIHADAIKDKNVRGLGVYTLSEQASDKEAANLAKKENRADIIAGIDLQGESDGVTDILIDLAQRETKNRSVEFARALLVHISRATSLRQKALRFAGFQVLKAPDIPSVLIELGFLTNRQDEKQLTSKKWRRNMVAAMVKATDKYFTERLAEGM